MGAAIILAPVVGLVLLFVVATLIPVLPLLATFFVRFWLVNVRHSRRRPYDLPMSSVRG
jgi:hypothetical protein